MSDAREIVQPRWKRRATEIAEAIGGNSAGVSSVSLDSNTITQLSQAIADAIALKTLDINIEKYSGVDYGTAGMPMQQGYSAVTGNKLPFHVAQQGTIDVNVTEFNDVSVDSRGLPVQAGRTTSTNALVPLVVNCPTVNNFPSGGGGTGGGLNITDTTTAFKNALYGSGVAAANANMIHSVEVGTSNAINTTLRNPNFPLAVDITRIRGTNVATSAGGVGAHFPIATYTSALNVSGAAVTFPSTMAVTLPVDANNVTIPLATTETAPVTTVSVNNHPTTVSVDNHPTSTTITGTVSVTETNPVSGGGGGGGGTSLTQQQVETAMDNALANATGISITETAPVTAVAVTNPLTHQQVETAMDNSLANAIGISITETAPVTESGIIFTKNYPVGITAAQLSYITPGSGAYFPQYNGNIEAPYLAEGYGHWGITANQTIPSGQSIGASTGTASHITWSAGMTAPWSSGWTIIKNGIEIQNQDITFGIVNNGILPEANNLIMVDRDRKSVV